MCPLAYSKKLEINTYNLQSMPFHFLRLKEYYFLKAPETEQDQYLMSILFRNFASYKCMSSPSMGCNSLVYLLYLWFMFI